MIPQYHEWIGKCLKSYGTYMEVIERFYVNFKTFRKDQNILEGHRTFGKVKP
jgi:hypothetical protein